MEPIKVVLIRHGARYHVYDIYDSRSTKPLWEQLTAVGMRQHQALGKIIRSQYIDGLKFLSDNFNKKEIEIIATPYNRTLQSA